MAGGEDEDYYYSDEYSNSFDSTYSRSESESEEAVKYYITKESQENITEASRKYSYTGLRDLTDLDKVQEKDIVDADGTVRGVENRVRAGLANFENKEALEKVRGVGLACSCRCGWGSLAAASNCSKSKNRGESSCTTPASEECEPPLRTAAMSRQCFTTTL